jgi:hypothetical protein
VLADGLGPVRVALDRLEVASLGATQPLQHQMTKGQRIRRPASSSMTTRAASTTITK